MGVEDAKIGDGTYGSAHKILFQKVDLFPGFSSNTGIKLKPTKINKTQDKVFMKAPTSIQSLELMTDNIYKNKPRHYHDGFKGGREGVRSEGGDTRKIGGQFMKASSERGDVVKVLQQKACPQFSSGVWVCIVVVVGGKVV